MEKVMADDDIIVSDYGVIPAGAYGSFGRRIQPVGGWSLTNPKQVVRFKKFIDNFKGKGIRIYGVTNTSNKNIINEVSGGRHKIIWVLDTILIWQYNEEC